MHKNDFHQGPSTTPILRRGCRHRRRNIAHRLRKLGVWEKKLALSKSCPTKIHQRQNWSLCKKNKQKLVAKQFSALHRWNVFTRSVFNWMVQWSKTSLEKKELNHVKPDLTTSSSMSPKRSSSGGSSGRSSEGASISYQVKVWKQVVETMLSNAWGGKLLCGCLTPPTTPTSNYK